MIRDILESDGYDVVHVADGAAAVKAYLERRDEIDLVILDMRMPVMNGEEAFKELKKIAPDIRILLSSGDPENADARRLPWEAVSGRYTTGEGKDGSQQ